VFCLPFPISLVEAANADVLCTQTKEQAMQLKSLTHTAATLAVLSLLLLIPSHKAHAQTEMALYSFCSDLYCYDGELPYGSLTPDGYGDFFGTANFGGVSSCYVNEYCNGGVVFQVIPEPTGGCPSGSNAGNGWCQFVVYNFCTAAGYAASDCPDGESPFAALTAVSTGPFSNRTLHLFGTTYNGGTSPNCTDPDGCGTVFELSPESPPEGCPSGTTPGNNGWCETVIYNFCLQENCTDGVYPMSGLVRDSSGNLYGTVPNGVFELSSNGKGGWNEALIYPYNSDTNLILGGLAMDSAGNLYGVDENADTGGGDVFMLNLDRVPTTIHTFSGALTDGFLPNGQPVVDSAGNVYGTTLEGGKYNQGIVWKLTPVTTGEEAGTYKEKILHTFVSGASGNYPEAGVTLDSSGNIYGTTAQGGKYQVCTNSSGSKIGCGTVFELAVSDETYKFKLLTSFNGTDGAVPIDSPVLDSSGKLYGTTLSGGANGGGTVFAVNPSAAATTTTLTSSPNPSISGEAVTFTATVSSSAGAPPDGETVNFVKGLTVLGTGTLSGGSASFTTSSLPLGTSVVGAEYSGDLNFEPGTSTKVKQVVEK
jgi:uncharacterized repeat protein (TIGR03803 family)